jgi:hypothetical protein
MSIQAHHPLDGADELLRMEWFLNELGVIAGTGLDDAVIGEPAREDGGKVRGQNPQFFE